MIDFPRQPKPVLVSVMSADNMDRDNVVRLLESFLKKKFDLIDTATIDEAKVIRCFPRAVND